MQPTYALVRVVRGNESWDINRPIPPPAYCMLGLLACSERGVWVWIIGHWVVLVQVDSSKGGRVFFKEPTASQRDGEGRWFCRWSIMIRLFESILFFYLNVFLLFPYLTKEYKKKSLLWPEASQWRIYYHRMWGKLSTTCSYEWSSPMRNS